MSEPVLRSYASIVGSPKRRPSSSSSSDGSFVEQQRRQAVQRLGSSTSFSSDADIELDYLDPSGAKTEPKTDPMEHLYINVYKGDYEYTQSIEEDLDVLREYGFIIDYPNGCLGSGLYGDVYKGVYKQKVS